MMKKLAEILAQAMRAESPRDMHNLVCEAHSLVTARLSEQQGGLPEGLVWIETERSFTIAVDVPLDHTMSPLAPRK